MSDAERRIVPYPIAWFNDLHTRGLLDLAPPYQRRSVWNQQYREYFIETILLNYPAPPIFLHEVIDSDGLARYSVVDGKQRLLTILDFVKNDFAVGEDASIERLQGRYFVDFDDASRSLFWRYQLSVEFLPYVDEGTLKNVFDRLNRNVVRLTRQELRHARFSGELATSAEAMTEVMFEELGKDFPHIARASRRQMREVELVAQLLLLAEMGPETWSQDDLDEAYSERDTVWELRNSTERRFRRVLRVIRDLLDADASMAGSRLRNQADFYSLFGAIIAILDEKKTIDVDKGAKSLTRFVAKAGDESARQKSASAKSYYEAARSASNDRKQRVTRIEILEKILLKV